MGFNTLVSALPLRRNTPQQEPPPRPKTAPTPNQPLVRPNVDTAQRPERRVPIPPIHIPSLAEPEQPCPYDETKYHSFSSTERRRCTFCGMRPPSRLSSSSPCKECRSRSPFSHMKLGFGHRPKLRGRKEVKPSTLEAPEREQDSSDDEGPRIVPREIAAKRIGNPPRKAALPVPRAGALNNSLDPLTEHPPYHSTKRTSASPSKIADTARPQAHHVRPTSPRLHYLHGLPDSKAYPYVRKSEVQQHFAALRAGSPSPLAEFALAAEQQKRKQDRSADFSETVYYGRIPKPALVPEMEKRDCPEQPGRSNVVVVVEEETLQLGGHIVITECVGLEQQHDLDERLHSSMHATAVEHQHSQPRFFRLFSRSNSRAASPASDSPTPRDAEPIVRLRGGDDTHNTAYPSGCGLLLKQLLLTCHRPRRGGTQDTDSSSDEHDSPPRIADPVRIACVKRRNTGTARLPRNIQRRDAVSRTVARSRTFSVSIHRDGDGDADTTTVSSPRTATPTTTHRTPGSPAPCIPPSSFRCPSSPLSLPLKSCSHSNKQTPTPALPPVPAPLDPPCLRGGAGSPSTLRNNDTLPPTLFWLAGGSRRPVDAARWKARKPQTRMGGWLGWAVYGLNGGKGGKGESERDGNSGEAGKGGRKRGKSHLQKEKEMPIVGSRASVRGGVAAEAAVGAETGGHVASGSGQEGGGGEAETAVQQGAVSE